MSVAYFVAANSQVCLLPKHLFDWYSALEMGIEL